MEDLGEGTSGFCSLRARVKIPSVWRRDSAQLLSCNACGGLAPDTGWGHYVIGHEGKSEIHLVNFSPPHDRGSILGWPMTGCDRWQHTSCNNVLVLKDLFVGHRGVDAYCGIPWRVRIWPVV